MMVLFRKKVYARPVNSRPDPNSSLGIMEKASLCVLAIRPQSLLTLNIEINI
jgi:hypothetical protein